MAQGKKILVAPLDWGLGHATRCTSLIRKLEMEGHEVWIGATGSGLAFLKKQFPKNNFLGDIPAYNILYNYTSGSKNSECHSRRASVA
jgi:hypothetical protein